MVVVGWRQGSPLSRRKSHDPQEFALEMGLVSESAF